MGHHQQIKQGTVAALRSVASHLARNQARQNAPQGVLEDLQTSHLTPHDTSSVTARAGQVRAQNLVGNDEKKRGTAEVARLAVSASAAVGKLLEATGRAGWSAPGVPMSNDWRAGLLMAAHYSLQRGLQLSTDGKDGTDEALGACGAALDLFSFLENVTVAEDGSETLR